MTIKLRIKNFNCEACMKLSQSMLSEIPGVKSVRVKNMEGDTEVEADRDISLAEFQKVLEGTNYEVIKL